VDVSGDLGWWHGAGAVLIEGPLANNRRSSGWAWVQAGAWMGREVRVDVS
jgi:hypothetical protein